MLDGIAANKIIVGAYATSDGVCPMLAAHRAGGRTNLIAFAKAWDRFAFRDARSRRARRATERELLILKAHLEASLLDEDAPVDDLAAARTEHLELLARRASRPPAGDPTHQLSDHPAWTWRRIVRRDDDYGRILTRLEVERASAEQVNEREPAANR
jgi:hypothetical protein